MRVRLAHSWDKQRRYQRGERIAPAFSQDRCYNTFEFGQISEKKCAAPTANLRLCKEGDKTTDDNHAIISKMRLVPRYNKIGASTKTEAPIITPIISH